MSLPSPTRRVLRDLSWPAKTTLSSTLKQTKKDWFERWRSEGVSRGGGVRACTSYVGVLGVKYVGVSSFVIYHVAYAWHIYSGVHTTCYHVSLCDTDMIYLINIMYFLKILLRHFEAYHMTSCAMLVGKHGGPPETWAISPRPIHLASTTEMQRGHLLYSRLKVNNCFQHSTAVMMTTSRNS